MKWLKFRSAFVEGAWRSPYFFEVDAAGKILRHQATLEAKPSEDVDAYLLPGVPNAHSHSFQYVMSGLSERVVPGREKDDFWFWREQMYRLANTIELDELLAVTTQLYMNMLEYGYTSVAEFHYLNHDFEGRAFTPATRVGEVLMEAAKQAGIHLTLIPVYYNQAAPNVPIKPQQKRFYFGATDRYLKFIDEMVSVAKTHDSDALIGYGVHSLRAATPEDIKTVLSTPWTQGPCHLHASEQTADVDSFLKAYGVRPIDWLFDQVPLSDVHNLVHATHINEQESEKLVKSGATVVLCPTTEANLGDGIFPMRDYHLAGGSWSVGTDSQVNLNPFIEMTSLELTQRLLDRKRNVLCREGEYVSGEILFGAALKGGRKSLGLKDDPFAKGQYLQGILIDPHHDRLEARPMDSVLSILCYAPEKDYIKGVYSQGRLQVEGGKHSRKESNRTAYKKSVQRLLSSLQNLAP